jgi:hypothetical protein
VRSRDKPSHARCAVGSDLIEAGLNEPLPRPSNGRASRPMILNDRQAQNACTTFAVWHGCC